MRRLTAQHAAPTSELSRGPHWAPAVGVCPSVECDVSHVAAADRDGAQAGYQRPKHPPTGTRVRRLPTDGVAHFLAVWYAAI